MTEEEAKTRWCPFSRVGSETTGLGALNRDVRKGPFPEALCIASACMAWQWQARDLVRIKCLDGSTFISERPAGFPAESIVEELPDHGFCGLAGSRQ